MNTSDSKKDPDLTLNPAENLRYFVEQHKSL